VIGYPLRNGCPTCAHAGFRYSRELRFRGKLLEQHSWDDAGAAELRRLSQAALWVRGLKRLCVSDAGLKPALPERCLIGVFPSFALEFGFK